MSMLDTVAYDLLSLIVHKDNRCHELTISISVGLLLLVVGHYRFLLIRLLCLFSLVPGSSISMLLNVLSCWSTYFSFEGIAYTLILRRLWWVGVKYYLLLSFHWCLVLQVVIDTYAWWGYMLEARLATLLLIYLLLHLILLWLTFLLLIWYPDDHIDVLKWCFDLVGFIRQVDLFSDVEFSWQCVIWVQVGIVQVFFVSVDKF